MTNNAKEMSEKPVEINAFLISTQLKDVEINQEVMEAEYVMSNSWHEEGLIENLFARVKDNKLGGGILVMRAKTLEEAKTKMSELPLATYFEKIDYIAIDKLY
ncbi:hypothetical protein [Streptococcus equinus]|uniref:hypothetical protein n=1 Tax=Streptococcus equinus TaxID=1335 RepID=UPI003BF7C1C5